MKTGKYIPLGEYNKIKIGYGTIDHKNLKTIYIKLNSWVEPNNFEHNFDSIVFKSKKKIKDYFYFSLNNEYFKKETIVDLDIRTKGVKADKRSFMNLEITLFVDEYFDVKQKEIKTMMKNIIKNIIDVALTDKSLYNFNEKKAFLV